MRRPIRRRAGFTLIELLVSVAVMGVVVVYLTQNFTTQHQAYTVVDQVAEAQQSLRVISSLLERELRHSGYLVPEAAAFCGVDIVNGPDTLFVSDTDAVDLSGVVENDLGARILSGFTGGTGTDVLSVSSTTLDANPSYDNDGDGLPDSDFRDGAGVIIVDRANPSRGAVCGRVDSDPSATSVEVAYLPIGGNVLAPVPVGGNLPELVAVPANLYVVNAPTSQLIRNGNVLAEGVEDLQFAAFYDTNGDGLVLDPTLEYPGALGSPVYKSDLWDNRDLREVRLSLVVRSADPDPEFDGGEFQTTENRNPPGGGSDGFRRRVVQFTVRPRNVGNR